MKVDALYRLKAGIPFSLSEDLRQVIEEYELEINRRTDAILARDRAYELLKYKVAELEEKLEKKADLLGKANALARIRGERVEELLANIAAARPSGDGKGGE